MTGLSRAKRAVPAAPAQVEGKSHAGQGKQLRIFGEAGAQAGGTRLPSSQRSGERFPRSRGRPDLLPHEAL